MCLYRSYLFPRALASDNSPSYTWQSDSTLVGEFLSHHPLSLSLLPLCFSFLASLVFCQCENSPKVWQNFLIFLPPDICSGFPLQFQLAGDLSIVVALFQQLVREKVRQFSDCPYPERFTMSAMAENAVPSETAVPGPCVEGTAQVPFSSSHITNPINYVF